MFKTIFPVIRNGYQNVLLSKEPNFTQQTRNTFILKRRWPPGLHTKNEKPHILRGKHHVYDLVEDRSVKKRPNIEVILTAFVDGVGHRADVVSVKRSTAYNRLLLPGVAVYKTDENMKKYAVPEEKKESILHSSPFAQRTVDILQRRTLSVIMNKDEPWVLRPWHIRASLRKASIYAAEGTIELPKEPITGPDLLKQNKEFYVTVTVNNLEKAGVTCRIHHWSTDPSKRLPYVLDHWKIPAEPLFGNDSRNDDVKT